MDPTVDYARLLKRNDLCRAAWPFVGEWETMTKDEQAARFADFVTWARANGFEDMHADELEWAFNRASFDRIW